ncbi:DNA-binding protein [Streptomyces sp. NRRL F-5755]|uniref:helix-turn-helix domain-containing protein n=1 Tax=Streptomyces sp. NRRL F-5755 TaxID=1519475 RepID=UPI0006B03F20|nr:helix-turn-helix transcriptional regulator [Streptomyces sp. NRRL F-5755]KOT95791.1 DNA-binding protein [Streptomyces sp. NRRL F-5755]
MAGSTGSSEPECTDSLKSFGSVVKVFRERAGLTQEELAPLVRFSPQTVASIEQGRRLAPPEFIERAEEVLDAFGVLQAAAEHLTRRRGLTRWFRLWAALERQALALHTYECRLIPGLLQTEAYARAVFHQMMPPLSDDQIETKLADRMERQLLLQERPNTTFSFIVEEANFRRRVGGLDVIRDLIDHALEVAELRNVEMQVMPLGQGEHAALEGPFRLLETPDNKWHGYSEGQRSGQLLSDRRDISVLQSRYAKLRSQAPSPQDSASLLKQIRGAM